MRALHPAFQHHVPPAPTTLSAYRPERLRVLIAATERQDASRQRRRRTFTALSQRDQARRS